MAQALARALALLGLAAAPAFASGLPAHPPLPPERPEFLGDPAPAAEQPASAPASAQAAPAPVDTPIPPEARVDLPQPPYDPRTDRPDPEGFSLAERAGLADLTRKYAARNGVPLELLHRIIMRESRYRPGAMHRHYLGLMQITRATAHSMGYKGSAKGLLDAETNLAYATPYLANAWALSDGDMDKAVRLYAAGYYYTAKKKGLLGLMRDAHSPPVQSGNPAPEQASLAAPAPASPPPSVFGGLFDQR
jgi:soluble lytic murein transglycosylase-like protein